MPIVTPPPTPEYAPLRRHFEEDEGDYFYGDRIADTPTPVRVSQELGDLAIAPPSEDGSWSSGQSKGWCFTINNYGHGHQWLLRELAEAPRTSYLVFGREVSSTGTPHLQGFVYFEGNKRFNGVKGALPEGAHIERMRGTAYEAAMYCKKDGDYEEFGMFH